MRLLTHEVSQREWDRGPERPGRFWEPGEVAPNGADPRGARPRDPQPGPQLNRSWSRVSWQPPLSYRWLL